MIQVNDLVKRYAAFEAVKSISFQIEAGEVVGFLGPNGAGKTTTLRILSGFMPASSGVVRVAGHDVNDASRDVRRNIGYLPEDVPLYRDMTVTDSLFYMARLKELPQRQIRAEVNRLIEAVGLGPVQKKLIGRCSKGFRQRTGLAQAMIGSPPVLLLDEPTTGLDPNQVVEVRRLIKDLKGAQTVLLSSHLLAEVSQMAERVLIINQGTLVGEGTAEELAGTGATNELMVRTRGTVAAAHFEQVDGVQGVTIQAGGVFRLAVADVETTAPRVAAMVVRQGSELLELREQKVDLESVFRKLTLGIEDA